MTITLQCNIPTPQLAAAFCVAGCMVVLTTMVLCRRALRLAKGD